jgi:hypothetical protein
MLSITSIITENLEKNFGYCYHSVTVITFELVTMETDEVNISKLQRNAENASGNLALVLQSNYQLLLLPLLLLDTYLNDPDTKLS